MKERPILFNAEMVQAILSGRKTQTRRVIQSPARTMQANNINCISYREPGDKWYQDYVFSMRDRSGTWQDYTKEQFLAKCPLGQPGDQLWVRETFATGLCTKTTLAYKATHKAEDLEEGWLEKIKWRPSIHMPRWASRIQLKISNVGVQRLQDISSGDAVREGICQLPASGRYCINPGDQYFGGASHSAKEVYSWLWESIYGEGSWGANPWVWVIEFERVAPAGEQS